MVRLIESLGAATEGAMGVASEETERNQREPGSGGNLSYPVRTLLEGCDGGCVQSREYMLYH